VQYVAGAVHLQILTEDGAATTNQNASCLCSHICHLVMIRVHDLLSLSHTVLVLCSVMLQAIFYAGCLPVIHNHP